MPAAERVAAILPAADLDRLIAALRDRDYEVLAPVARQGSLSYQPISSAGEIARGWQDEQEAGSYSLSSAESELYFAAVHGSHSWKEQLFPARVTLWRGSLGARGPLMEAAPRPSPKRAFLGVRPCDLHAITVQDRVLLGGAYADADYMARRAASVIVAVNCTRAAPTCFCLSAGGDPRADRGFDLALTEVLDDRGHWFYVESGTDLGAEIVSALGLQPASGVELRAAEVALAPARQQQRTLPHETRELLTESRNAPLWKEMDTRCLSCGNCTMVCPTCFCVSVEEGTDLTLDSVERSRRWESCFTSTHSYIHGGSVHRSTGSRYRQWMTHKLSTWVDQFGISGCTGCGRCITWCPAAIDITHEAARLQEGREARLDPSLHPEPRLGSARAISAGGSHVDGD